MPPMDSLRVPEPAVVSEKQAPDLYDSGSARPFANNTDRQSRMTDCEPRGRLDLPSLARLLGHCDIERERTFRGRVFGPDGFGIVDGQHQQDRYSSRREKCRSSLDAPQLPMPSEGDAADRQRAKQHVVKDGDSLWKIAAQSLKSGGNEHPTARQIWKQVEGIVRANSEQYPSLRRNPDLIHPNMKLNIPTPGRVPDRPDDITPRPRPIEPTPRPRPIDPPPRPDDVRPDGPVAQHINDTARRLEGVRPQRFIPGVPSRLGCAAFVSGALVEAGFDRGILAAGTRDLEKKLLARGFVIVPESQRQAGDIVFGYTPGRAHGHTGVVTGRDSVMHNSSAHGQARSGTYNGVFGNFTQRIIYRYVGNRSEQTAV